jgi:dynein heavy chain 2
MHFQRTRLPSCSFLTQVEKVLQLHLACQQRIGVILVGPSGSGKSTLWGVLEAAYGSLGCKPVVHRMNPKAMARQQVERCWGRVEI